MNVKKYRAATAREALEQVKQELGDQAFVLETRQVKTGGFLGLKATKQVEISATASLEPDNENGLLSNSRKKNPQSTINLIDNSAATPEGDNEPVVSNAARDKILDALSIRAASAKSVEGMIPSASSPSRPRNIETVEISTREPRIIHASKPSIKPAVVPAKEFAVARKDYDLLRAELREMKFSLGAIGARQSVRNEVSEAVFSSKQAEVFRSLNEIGLNDSRVTKAIVSLTPEFKKPNQDTELLKERVLRLLLEDLEFIPNAIETHNKIAFIGATGVGKTTTIAKLAARASLNNDRPIELLTLDTYRIAAVDQLKTYADIVGAKCHIYRTVEELDEKLRNISDDTTVLIDTTGRSPYDLSDQFHVSDYLANNPRIHKCLTFQATINKFDAMASVKKFEMYGVDSVTVTKLDETSRPGAVVDIASQAGKPLSYICMGQRVPEDINNATVGNLVQQICHPEKHAVRMSA